MVFDEGTSLEEEDERPVEGRLVPDCIGEMRWLASSATLPLGACAFRAMLEALRLFRDEGLGPL